MNFARSFVATLRTDLIVIAQYRANVAIWSIASVLQVVVYLSVWRAVAEAGGAASTGYTASEFAGYFLVLLIVREATYGWMPYLLADHVRDGKLSLYLMRPFHPLGAFAATMVAHRVQSVLMLVPVAVLLGFVFDASLDPQWWTIALSVLVVLPMAALLRMLVDSLFALSSMWLTRIDGLRNMYYLVLLLLGGQFAPVDVLPGPVHDLALALPFYWTLGFPTELLAGRATPQEAAIGIGVLAAWSLATYVVLQPAWRRSTRAYEAVGS